MIDKFSFYFFPSIKEFDINIQLKILENIKIVVEILEKYYYNSDKTTLLKEYEIAPDYSLLPGGHQTLFVWLFSISDQIKLVIKPYNLSISELVLHCLSIEEFRNIYTGYKININSRDIGLKIMDIFLLGAMSVGSKTFPFMVQEFSSGKKIQNTAINDKTYVSNDVLTNLFKDIARNKFIVDPYLSNWRLAQLSPLELPVLEYIDLIFSIDSNTKTNAKNFLNNVRFRTIIL